MSQQAPHVSATRADRGKIAAQWPDQWPIESMSVKIVLPLLLATLLMAGCAIWLIDHSAIDTTRTRLAQLAVSVAEQMGRDSEQINDVLDSGSRLLEGTADINQADVNRLQEQIRPRLTGMPLMKGVVFSDETGTRRMVTRDFNDPLYGFDSRLFYQDYLRRPNDDVIVGAPFKFTTGGNGIPLIHPVRDNAGKFKGLVTVLLKAELLSEFYRSIAPSDADNIALLQPDGTPLVGKTELTPDVVEALLVEIPQSLAKDSRDDDIGDDAAPVDLITQPGHFSYLAAKRVPHLPIVAVAMTSRLGVINGWALQASIVAGVIIAAGLALVGLTIYLGRKIMANERSLLAQAEFTNLIIDSAEVLIFVRNRDGKILRVNETAERHLGYPAEALKDHDVWLSMLPPEERERVRDIFMSNDPARYPNTQENHLVTRHGERRLYRWSNVAVLDKSGQISLVIGIGEDITTAAQTRRLQERSVAAMSQAHRLAGMRYYFSSPQLSPQEAAAYSFHSRMAEVLEIPADAIPRDADAFIDSFIHPDDWAQTRQQYDAFGKGESDQYVIEYRVSKPTGEIRYIREGTKRLVDAIDNTTQSIGVIQDITDLKHTQLALERNAALMNRAQSIAKMCHWYFEPAANPTSYDDGRYYYSDNAVDIFGLPASQLNMPEAEFSSQVVHPDDRDFVYDSYRAFVTGPDLKYQRVYRLLLPDGSVRYISDAGEKRLSSDGKLKLVLGISQDVTTLHLSEASLRRAENQLRHAMRIAAMGHWHAETSETTRHRYALQYSEEAAAIFGVTPAQLQQLDIADFVDRFVLPDDRPQAHEKLQQFWNGAGTHLAMEFHILRSDGAIRVVRVLAERVRMTHPSQVQITGMVQDITDLKHHELVLRQTEALLQHAHRLAKIGYWLWHPSETLDAGAGSLTYSDGLRAMLGIDTSDYHGSDETFCQLYVHPDDRQMVLQGFIDYRRGVTDSYNLDYRFIRPDGDMINLRVVAMRVRDETGHILYAIGVAQDITEQKQHEEDLIQAKNDADLANRSKTEFLANMSHELRTPLNAVIGFSQLIRDQAFGASSDRYVSYAEDINASGKLLLDLINDILDMSRIEAGRHMLAEEELSIPAAIQDCLRLVSPRAADGQVTLELQIPADLPWVYADMRSLKQILLNVLSNAVKFTLANGRVQIQAMPLIEGGLQIRISDTGIGIAPDVLPMLFAPFRQGDNSISRRFGGTGLGLAISRKLIELHGGSIQIDSTVGQGTTVCLNFPVERVMPARIGGRERTNTAIAG